MRTYLEVHIYVVYCNKNSIEHIKPMPLLFKVLTFKKKNTLRFLLNNCSILISQFHLNMGKTYLHIHIAEITDFLGTEKCQYGWSNLTGFGLI